MCVKLGEVHNDPEEHYRNDLLRYEEEKKKCSQKMSAYQIKRDAYSDDEARVHIEYRDLWHDTKMCSRCAHIYS
jgi:hypothetical protein